MDIHFMHKKLVFAACLTQYILQQQKYFVAIIFALRNYNIISVTQLLEGLGVFRHNTKRMDDPYQDTMSAPLDREFDNDAVGQEDEDDDTPDVSQSETVAVMLTTIVKVS